MVVCPYIPEDKAWCGGLAAGTCQAGANEWSGWQSAIFKEYTFLPEGKYTFQVKAKNIFETESNLSTFSFVVKPPIYRSKAAYISYIIILALLIFGVVFYFK